MLKSLSSATPEELMQTWSDGRIKMFLTQCLLRFRREHGHLLQRGEYSPVQTSGTFAECCVSFVRRLEDNWIVVIAPRLSARIGFPPIGEAWKDTAIELPETLSLRNTHDFFTCSPVRDGKRRVLLQHTLSVLPFAVITNV